MGHGEASDGPVWVTGADPPDQPHHGGSRGGSKAEQSGAGAFPSKADREGQKALYHAEIPEHECNKE